jgi:hypothetical protein
VQREGRGGAGAHQADDEIRPAGQRRPWAHRMLCW